MMTDRTPKQLTDEQIEQQRVLFEAWANEFDLERLPEGFYKVYETEDAWDVWQAAILSQQAQAEPVTVAPYSTAYDPWVEVTLPTVQTPQGPALVVYGDSVGEHTPEGGSFRSVRWEKKPDGSVTRTKTEERWTTPPAAPSAEARDAWQGIESAPDDDREVLVFRCGRYEVASKIRRVNFHGVVSYEGWQDSDGLELSEPTHWMPLPEPPVLAAHGGAVDAAGAGVGR